MHQFVNETIKGLTQSIYENELMDNLSTFYEDFASRPDIQSIKKKMQDMLRKKYSKNARDLHDDEDVLRTANGDTFNRGRNSIRVGDDQPKQGTSILKYILIIGGILVAVLIIAVSIMYLMDKNNSKSARRLLNDELGQNVIEERTIYQKLSNAIQKEIKDHFVV